MSEERIQGLEIRPGDRIRLRRDGREYPARVIVASEDDKSLVVQLDRNPGLQFFPLAADPATGEYAVTLMLLQQGGGDYCELASGEVFEVHL
jgi:hypothetical protein